MTESTINKPDLAKKTIAGGFSTILMQGSITIINLLGLMVLARIVDPENFGLIAKVTAMTGLVALVGDMGLSIATIQSEKISDQQLSSLFWVNVIVSCFIAALTAAMSPLIAIFYDDSRVIWVAIAFASNALFAGVGVQHRAILSRHMRFTRIAIIQVAATAIGITAAIIAVWAFELGYWALLIQIMVTTSVKTAGFWLGSGWLPSRHLFHTGIRDKLKMGGNFTIATFINYFARNGDNVLIAKFWGEQSVAFYAKAYSLLLLPMRQLVGPMSQVAVPALSRLQSDPDRYRTFFRKGVSIAMVLQIPITIFAAAAGSEIVLAILGPSWKTSIPIFYALVPNLFVSATAPATQWVFISRGDTARLVKMVLVNSVVVLLGFVIGLPYGPIGVAWSFSITTCIVRIPSILYCFKPSPLSAKDFFPFMIAPTICSLLAAIGCLACVIPIINSPPWIILATKLVCFGAIYLSLISFTNAGKDFFNRVLTYVKPLFDHIRPKRQAT